MVKFSVTPRNTNKYPSLLYECIDVKRTNTQCERESHTRTNREINGKHASGEWATSERFQFEPCYSYRLRIRAVKMNGTNRSRCQ